MYMHSSSKPEAKFTRGEKCIYIHLVITFISILIISLLYFIHLWVIKHTYRSALSIGFRRSLIHKGDAEELSLIKSIGVVYLNVTMLRLACNTLLLRRRWSAGPAHCAAMRNDPDLVEVLPAWNIKYRRNDRSISVTGIKRSVPHPHFNRDDFDNNIGLFEHKDPIATGDHDFIFSNDIVNLEILRTEPQSMQIISWDPDIANNDDDRRRSIHKNAAQMMDRDKCVRAVAPVVDLRTHEICVTFRPFPSKINHGALFVVKSKILGFFAWGDRQGKGIPFIVLSIKHYKDWLEDVTSL